MEVHHLTFQINTLSQGTSAELLEEIFGKTTISVTSLDFIVRHVKKLSDSE